MPLATLLRTAARERRDDRNARSCLACARLRGLPLTLTRRHRLPIAARRLVRTDARLTVFLLLVVALDVYIYAHHPDRPSAPGEGWDRVWDQGQYTKSA